MLLILLQLAIVDLPVGECVDLRASMRPSEWGVRMRASELWRTIPSRCSLSTALCLLLAC